MPEERPHILLIDDSMVDLRQLIALMTSRDLRVSVAFNGRDGLHKAELLQDREQNRLRARLEGGRPAPKQAPQNSQRFSIVMPQF